MYGVERKEQALCPADHQEEVSAQADAGCLVPHPWVGRQFDVLTSQAQHTYRKSM